MCKYYCLLLLTVCGLAAGAPQNRNVTGVAPDGCPHAAPGSTTESTDRDTCKAEDNTMGTCQPIDKCNTLLRSSRNIRNPCGRMGMTRIVCCPASNPVSTIEDLITYVRTNQKRILPSTNMTCEEMPALCNQNTKGVLPPPEPPQCPPLDPPPSKPTDIAFEKCLEYRRYGLPCVVDETQDNKYVREDACGIKQFADRIYGGTPAEPKEFPHMALLGCRNELNTAIAPLQWVAGGTLISDKYILTAGHVLTHNDYGPIRYALLGVTNKTEAREPYLYSIVNTIAHKLYVRNQKPHDIALLELNRRVELSEHIRPACLPSPGMEMIDPITRTLAGWGRTENASSSEVLMKVYVAELDYETECKSRLPNNVNSVFRKDSMICAGATTKEKGDSCPGDSGGPLMALARDLHCTYIVRGVVTFGPGCGSEDTPGIYTDVRAYLPWIIENVWRN